MRLNKNMINGLLVLLAVITLALWLIRGNQHQILAQIRYLSSKQDEHNKRLNDLTAQIQNRQLAA